jgi:hypothetical protein
MHRTRRLYESLVTLPDRLYPFRVEVDGEYVRGVRAYQARLAQVEHQYGQGHYGYRLEAYRQLFHLAGSLLFLIVAAYLSRAFFPGSVALDAFLGVAVVFITFQEFYLHRKLYAQLWKKGLLDWVSWCVPIGAYLLFSLR